MNKKMITFAAAAFGIVGAFTLGPAATTAEAGVFSVGSAMAGSANAGMATEVGYRRGYRVKQRRVVRHKRFKRHHRFHRRALGANGIYMARVSLCNAYYNNAVNTGSRYWWHKYKVCVRSF